MSPPSRMPEPEPLPGMPVPPPPLPVSANTVDIHIELSSYGLTVDEVFPDGCPNPSGFWSAETLAIFLGMESSSALEMLSNWNLGEPEVTLRDDQGRTVTVKFGLRQ